MNLDLMHLWGQMGWFAKGVVGVLFIMSVLSLTVAFQKFMMIRKSQQATRKFAPEFSRAIQEGSLENAIRLAEKNKFSHVSRDRKSTRLNSSHGYISYA